MRSAMHPRLPSAPRAARRRERGATLIVAALFLIVVSVLGIAGWQIGTQQERMTGLARDRQLAFEAAELALRDAERDLLGVCVVNGCQPRSPAIEGLTGFGDGAGTPGRCSGLGLCLPAGARPNYPLIDRGILIGSADINWGRAVTIGTFTHPTTPDLRGVSRLPAYVIEGLCLEGSSGAGAGAGVCSPVTYRLTAIGYGLRPETQVVLQSFFKTL